MPKELKDLQDKRAKLEDESRTLKEEQKNLEENVKELEQKIMERLKNENKTRRQDISRLKSAVDELGQKFSQFSQTQENSESTEEATSKSYLKKCVECEKDIPIASEECQYCGARQTENAEPADEAVSEERETTQEEPAEETVKIGVLEDSTRVTKDEIGEKLSRLNGKRKDGFLQSLFR